MTAAMILAALCATLAAITLWPSPLKPRILLALDDGPKLMSELRAITGSSYGRLARALDQLERSDAIEKGQAVTTQSGRPVWPYQLKEPQG